jgi:glycosyltransferase involved in cell wall biosynthesis
MKSRFVPKVSIVTAFYNRAKFLPDCIESILAQSFADFEYILWDDGSTDNGREVVERYADRRIKLCGSAHQGRALSLRDAIKQTECDYMGWVDSDDILLPAALSLTKAILDGEPEVGLVYTHQELIGEEELAVLPGARKEGESSPSLSLEDSSGKHAISLRPHRNNTLVYSPEKLLQVFMAMQFRLMRRSVFDAAGGINLLLPQAVCYDLVLRISETARIECLPEVLYRYRQHSGQQSHENVAVRSHQSFCAIRQAIARRRLSHPPFP